MCRAGALLVGIATGFLIALEAGGFSASAGADAFQRRPELSAQARRYARRALVPRVRRAPVRIRVTPLTGPLQRECVPVFEERFIPQWGGAVLYASQRCRWVREAE